MCPNIDFSFIGFYIAIVLIVHMTVKVNQFGVLTASDVFVSSKSLLTETTKLFAACTANSFGLTLFPLGIVTCKSHDKL